MPRTANKKRTPDVKWLTRSTQSVVVRNLLTVGASAAALPSTRLDIYAVDASSGQIDELLLRSDVVPESCNPTWSFLNFTSSASLLQHVNDQKDENVVLLSQQIDLSKLLMFGYVRYEPIELPVNFVALNIDDYLYITERTRQAISASSDNAAALKKFLARSTAFLEVDDDDDDDNDNDDSEGKGDGGNEAVGATDGGGNVSSSKLRDPIALKSAITSCNAALEQVRASVSTQIDNLNVTHLVTVKTKKELELEQLKAEVAYAESDLHDEEAMLEQELASFAEVVDIEEMMKLCDEAIAGREEAQLALVEKKKNLVKAKFLLEARQLKLLSDLQTIYPIEKNDGGEYAIRGLELPADMQSKDDEVISAALGYVVHLIVLASKYLEVPLRYQLLYMGSRSFIRDPVLGNSGGTYPLFKRNVEKDRFDRGVQWLKRDVEQLLLTRGIHYDAGRDILHNLHQLFYCEMCPKLAV